MPLKTVRIPQQFEPLFSDAEQYVENYFNKLKMDPTAGTITIGDERYILVRAASLSVHFLEFIKSMYPSLDDSDAIRASSKVLFDIAHNIGNSDAKEFHKITNVENPIAKLSTGPIHFSYTGWAYVDIKDTSNPVPDENYYLLYDHPQSFEADSWILKKNKTDFCTCFMNAGYSSGWCEASFGIPLVAKEILCRAKGDEYCRFIMSQPHRLDEFVARYESEQKL